MAKGKKMGCVKNEKSADIDELLKSDVFKSTRELVEQSEKNTGMDLDFTELTELEDL
jgi:hypothetical protein